jgi:hypothetical protein
VITDVVRQPCFSFPGIQSSTYVGCVLSNNGLVTRAVNNHWTNKINPRTPRDGRSPNPSQSSGQSIVRHGLSHRDNYVRSGCICRGEKYNLSQKFISQEHDQHTRSEISSIECCVSLLDLLLSTSITIQSFLPVHLST